jgi:hypothetical protein
MCANCPFSDNPVSKKCASQTFTYVVRAKGLEGRIALPFGGFFHQGSQQEERFPYKPSGDRSFGIKCLKTLKFKLFKRSRSKLNILRHIAADDLAKIFALVPF